MASCKQQHPSPAQGPHLLHVVAVPYPAQGHINPLLQLCEQLVPLGFTFTFINTHHIHQRLHRAGSICPAPPAADHGNDTHNGVGVQVQDVVHHYRGCSSIRMMYVEGGCAPEKHAHKSTEIDAFVAAQGICEPVEHLLSQIREEREVSYFMSDSFLGWSSATARKFDLPWLSFWPASAASLSALIYFSDLASEGDACIAYADMEDEEAPPFEGIPGLPPTNRCDVPKAWNAQGKVNANLGKLYVAMEQSCVVLLNSFEELEGQVLEALSKRMPIQAVGPLLPSRCMLHICPDKEEAGTLIGRPSLFAEDSSCLAWLDTQAPSSVLFISFGSISLRSNEQLQELAAAVEASGCPFLWVCKSDISHGPDTNNQNLIFSNVPPRGMIVSWAPQLQVLSHPSVGGFMTHCGWNSVVESASLGVPMLCWGDYGERYCNQRLVVEFWKCGIHVVADARRAKQHIDDAVLVGRDDIEKSIRLLMLEDSGNSIRCRSIKLREAAIKAYRHTHAQLNQFAQRMKQACHQAT